MTTTTVTALPATLPRIVFVLGKGGVGRSTFSVALASEITARRRDARTLVFGWTISDPIAPWFGLAPSRLMPQEIAPRLHVANFHLDDTLKLYFVDHLKLPRFYRHVIHGDHVRRLIEASPGLAEAFFIGHLWWLTTLAKEEAGLEFDHIIVDAPATGHGASLFDLPEVLSTVGAAGLLRVESQRVAEMMSDPSWTGAIVVALPEELSAEETVELVPRISQRIRRKPIAAFINRSVASPRLGVRAVDEPLPLLDDDDNDDDDRLSPHARAALETFRDELRSKRAYETALRKVLQGTVERGVFALSEQLACSELHAPRDVVRALSAEIGGVLL